MRVTSWTVFFMFKPFTTIHTTLLTEEDDVSDETLIQFAKEKIQNEIGVNIDKIAERIGVNDNFGNGWITVEMNDTSATEKELEVLKVIKVSNE